VPLATQLLSELDTFDPFAAVVELDRTVSMWSFAAGDRAELVEMIRATFRNLIQDRGLRAVGICADVQGMTDPRTQEKTNALQVIYEDSTGKAFTSFIPYWRDESDKVGFGESYTVTNDPVFFTSSEV